MRTSVRQIAWGVLLWAGASFAPPRSVTVRWEPVRGATAYEVSVQNGKQVISQITLPEDSTHWNKTLPVGRYTLKVRAIDFDQQGGKWSPDASFIIPPDPTELLTPKDGAKQVTLHSKFSTLFSWKPVEGVSKYFFELSRSGDKVFAGELAQTEKTFQGLKPGEYTWQVTPILEGQPLEEGKSKEYDFEVYREVLAKPDVVGPVGYHLPVKKALRLQWKPVEGAEKYEVEVVQEEDIAGKPKKALYSTVSNSIDVPITDEGTYSWSVRALTNLDSTGKAEVRGPASINELIIEEEGRFKATRAVVQLNVGAEPADITMTSVSSGPLIAVGAKATRMSLSGKYWFNSNIGAEIAADKRDYAYESAQSSTLDFALKGKYAYLLSELQGERPNWNLIISPGVAQKQLFSLLIDSSAGAAAAPTRHTVSMTGAVLDLEIEKYFSTRFRVSLLGEIFVPFSFSVDGASSGFTAESSFSNLGLKLEATLAVSRKIALNAGINLVSKGASYTVSGNSKPEVTNLTSTGAFLGISWMFQK